MEAGTTSAYAENTCMISTEPSPMWNYLRVRGEYPTHSRRPDSNGELPPRTRRIRHQHITEIRESGTTSAYAENTSQNSPGQTLPGNYLRVRGEYKPGHCDAGHVLELPPRTRRIHWVSLAMMGCTGTTSAYAENTLRVASRKSRSRNYLRVRGEYTGTRTTSACAEELPPRTRRIHQHHDGS